MNIPQDPLTPAPEPNKRRNGKVARLPKATRDNLNQMLLDGLTYNNIIQALGEAGKDLNEDCIGTWKAGGYQDWLRQQQRIDLQEAKLEMALDLVRDNAGMTFHKVARQVVGSQVVELLLDFNPAAVLAALEEKPEIYPRLINALARLSEGESTCDHRRAIEAIARQKFEQQNPANQPKAISKETLMAIARQLKLA